LQAFGFDLLEYNRDASEGVIGKNQSDRGHPALPHASLPSLAAKAQIRKSVSTEVTSTEAVLSKEATLAQEMDCEAGGQ
jgi:hypothetical protein